MSWNLATYVDCRRYSPRSATFVVAVAVLLACAATILSAEAATANSQTAAGSQPPEGAVLAVADVPKFLHSAKCVSCHLVDETRVGPDFRSIATMYRGADESTKAVLARKIMIGGGGKWGVVPMVANPQVSLAEANAIVDWLATLDDQPVATPK
jgi:cytochrome c